MLPSRGVFTTGTFVVAISLFAGSAAAAQAATRRCDRPDTTASWYQRQRQWWALDTLKDWSNDSLRTALLRGAHILEPHPAMPFPLQLGATVMSAAPRVARTDSAEIEGLRQVLRDMAKTRNWPLRSTVGPAGVRAAWLLIRGDSSLTGTGMHRMMEAGPGEVSGFDVAVLEDWLRIETGRKQIYATQLRTYTAAGRARVAPAPTEDLRHVDLRRDEAALPPLTFALCTAGRTTR